jgi:hypothetical protein
MCAAGKNWRPNFLQICLKRVEKGPIFLEDYYFYKKLNISVEKYILFISLYLVFVPLAERNSVQKTLILALMRRCCVGPKFFCSGQIFWLIWPKRLVRSWQHWCLSSSNWAWSLCRVYSSFYKISSSSKFLQFFFLGLMMFALEPRDLDPEPDSGQP